MSVPRVVGPRQLDDVADALAAGRAVAVPGDGGYRLAVRQDHPGALDLLRAYGAPAAGTAAEEQIMVASTTQAVALTTPWSKETSQLTDRMWPGPLTVMLAARPVDPVPPGEGDAVVHLTMPSWRPLRTLVRRSGPLAVVLLHGADGRPLVLAEEVLARLLDADDVVFIVDGGRRDGPLPTVVDCSQSPPRVRYVGALPENYVEAALLMSGRKRTWFTRRNADDELR